LLSSLARVSTTSPLISFANELVSVKLTETGPNAGGAT
jgi:hypothetical protein